MLITVFTSPNIQSQSLVCFAPAFSGPPFCTSLNLVLHFRPSGSFQLPSIGRFAPPFSGRPFPVNPSLDEQESQTIATTIMMKCLSGCPGGLAGWSSGWVGLKCVYLGGQEVSLTVCRSSCSSIGLLR